MAPIPYIFKNETELIKKLQTKKLSKRVEEYYTDVKSLDDIVNKQVSSSTYRAFRKSESGVSPSDVFRKWIRNFIVKKVEIIKEINSQKEFDRFIHKSTIALCKYWKSEMLYDMGYGRAAKLLNLVLKVLPLYDGIKITHKNRTKLIQFLHVPLDSFTIRGLINVADFKISSQASMGAIKDVKDYEKFLNLIRDITRKADVPLIYFDVLAWDLAH